MTRSDSRAHAVDLTANSGVRLSSARPDEAGGEVRGRHGPEVVYFGLFDDCNAKCNMCACWRLPRSRQGVEHYRNA